MHRFSPLPISTGTSRCCYARPTSAGSPWTNWPSSCRTRGWRVPRLAGGRPGWPRTVSTDRRITDRRITGRRSNGDEHRRTHETVDIAVVDRERRRLVRELVAQPGARAADHDRTPADEPDQGRREHNGRWHRWCGWWFGLAPRGAALTTAGHRFPLADRRIGAHLRAGALEQAGQAGQRAPHEQHPTGSPRDDKGERQRHPD